jgi:hypothetical protein
VTGVRREGVGSRRTGPARHERPDIDEAALIAARAADRVLAAARDRGSERWVTFFATIPDRLRDDDLRDLRSTVLRARAAFGAKDSVRESLAAEVTEPLLESLDRLLRAIARREVAGG